MTEETKTNATVKVADAVFDGEGGTYAKGDKIFVADKDALKSLKDKGLVD